MKDSKVVASAVGGDDVWILYSSRYFDVKYDHGGVLWGRMEYASFTMFSIVSLVVMVSSKSIMRAKKKDFGNLISSADALNYGQYFVRYKPSCMFY